MFCFLEETIFFPIYNKLGCFLLQRKYFSFVFIFLPGLI